MLMRDENASQVLGSPAYGGQALTDLAQAETRVYQDAGLFSFQIGAIARGTAAQDSKANRHRLRYGRLSAGATSNWLQ